MAVLCKMLDKLLKTLTGLNKIPQGLSITENLYVRSFAAIFSVKQEPTSKIGSWYPMGFGRGWISVVS